MNFGNFNAEEVAKVVYGESGIFVGKNHDALLAIAQCVYDEWHSGLFGNDLAKILKPTSMDISGLTMRQRNAVLSCQLKV